VTRSRHQSQAHQDSGQRADQTRSDHARPNRTHVLNDVPPAPMLRANETQSSSPRPEWTTDPDQLASMMFDRAIENAHLTTAEVAYLFGVSESVVRRMRSKDARERVAFGQLLRLPPVFHIELSKLLNEHFGFRRAALLRLLDAVGDLAVAVEAR
jgi:hypothetical protein